LISEAVMGYYRAVAAWPGHLGVFYKFAWAYMKTAIREALRREVRHVKGWLRRRPPGVPARPAAKRDPAARQRHNQNYYLRHYEPAHCKGCGEAMLGNPGHGTQWCERCAPDYIRKNRAWRVRRKNGERPTCQVCRKPVAHGKIKWCNECAPAHILSQRISKHKCAKRKTVAA
jgi:hypothetical protein